MSKRRGGSGKTTQVQKISAGQAWPRMYNRSNQTKLSHKKVSPLKLPTTNRFFGAWNFNADTGTRTPQDLPDRCDQLSVRVPHSALLCAARKTLKVRKIVRYSVLCSLLWTRLRSLFARTAHERNKPAHQLLSKR